jgi:penicillin-binding protein 1A
MARFDGDTALAKREMRRRRPMMVFDWRRPGLEKPVSFSPYDSLAYYKRFLHAGFLAMDPLNGRIRAWVGGANFKYFKYDHVKLGRRQPGSTFKPIVYTAAIDNGFSPCYEVADVAVTFPAEAGRPPYTPRNFDGEYSGRRYTLRQALARSINSITAFLVKTLTPERVVKYAHDLGITGELEPLPPIGFGIFDVSIYEMVGAYGTFVNHGVRTTPVYISRIEDKAGNVLYESIPSTREVLSEQTAHVMLHMLQAATEAGGTAVSLRGAKYGLKGEIGGKTGTTSNYSDAWFMGLTPDLVCGTWVGGEDRAVHFRSGELGQGARQALPIYGLFMRRAAADRAVQLSLGGTFPRPEKELTIELDCERYKNGPAPDSTQLVPTTAPVEEADEI